MRAWLIAGLLLAGGAAAQPAPEASPAQAQAQPAQAQPEQSQPAQSTPAPAPAPRRPRVRTAPKPPPLPVIKEAARPLPPRVIDPRLANPQAMVLAPVPNRSLEAPRVIIEDRASLGPSVINRNLPGRGQASDGSVNLLEDKLFRPAPGARLSVPFSY
ncbi:MAG: hypothetical protein JWP04_508 [Belnapia sp.]|nr:hypothetical protein [Belnapia sp.]